MALKLPRGLLAFAVALTVACSGRGGSVLAGSLPHPGPVALDGTFAYVGTHDPGATPPTQILAVPLRGGEPKPIARLTGHPVGGLVAQGGSVYFTQAGTVSVVAPGATAPRVLATGQHEPWEVAVDATHAYFTNRVAPPSAEGSIARVPLAGGPVEVLARGLRSAMHLALGATDVYASADDALVRVAQAGGPAVVVAAGQGPVVAVATKGRAVYWATGGRGSGAIYRAEQPGGAPTRVAETEGIEALAVGEGDVYWTHYEGRIVRVDERTGSVTTLARGQARPHAIAAGLSFVVWTNKGEVIGEQDRLGALMGIAR